MPSAYATRNPLASTYSYYSPAPYAWPPSSMQPAANPYYPSPANWYCGYPPTTTGAWPHYQAPATAGYAQPASHYPAAQAWPTWPAYWPNPVYPRYR